VATRSTCITRWLILAAFLVVPTACDDIYTCGFDSGSDTLPHEPEIGYETNEGRYTLTLVSAEPWPPRAGEVRFELWPKAPAGAGAVKLAAAPAYRASEADGARTTIPLALAEPTDADGAWLVGPVELDAGLWHIPLQLTDARGRDAIELRIAVVDR
jgi:hypothetical protein